jgi:hypothetical protein
MTALPARLTACLLFTTLLAACSGVEGKYSHEEDLDGEGKAKVSLELKDDHKAVLSLSSGVTGAMSHEGTYEADGKQVSVVIAGLEMHPDGSPACRGTLMAYVTE